MSFLVHAWRYHEYEDLPCRHHLFLTSHKTSRRILLDALFPNILTQPVDSHVQEILGTRRGSSNPR